MAALLQGEKKRSAFHRVRQMISLKRLVGCASLSRPTGHATRHGCCKLNRVALFEQQHQTMLPLTQPMFYLQQKSWHCMFNRMHPDFPVKHAMLGFSS